MASAIWLIPALPLAGALLLVVAGRRLGEPLAGWLATTMLGGSFLVTLGVFADLLSRDPADRFELQTVWTWMAVGSFRVDVGFLADPLSITMCLFVTGVGTLIHLYSIGYMHGDPNFSKFFLYLNLFAASMLVLVLGDNLMMTFLGWEGVGACSYLLISFWFTNPANAGAGKKAFVTNRIGDFGFMIATFLLFWNLGSVRYPDIIAGASTLSAGTATAIVVLYLVAATGKSAQIPLFVWLPDAMAGPTPVSALIHAATMVTSGVYLLTRLNPVLAQADGWATDLIAWVGAITALVAATIAVAQTDIKKVLAYSTVSQLGYLFLAVGIGAYVPAIFHMVTHAFFKALLFLGSGSVIHGLEDEQDMRRMGGVAKWMPITASTFIVGWLAIAGVPPFSGFWSKDEILLYAYDNNVALWLVGLITAILTAFYMTRQVMLVFFGRSRFFDAHNDEIQAAFVTSVDDAQASVTAANDAVASAATAVEKAEAEVVKRQEALDKANVAFAEAEAEVGAANPEADGYDKLVKGLDKATKAVPKAESALEKAQAKLTEAVDAHSAATGAIAEAEAQVETAKTAAADAPRAPEFVTALTTGPDVSAFEDSLPASYQERQEYHPHESPWTMTLPLVALAGLALGGGLLNLPFTSDLHFLGNWLEPSLFGHEAHVGTSAGGKVALAVIAVVCGLVAIAAGIAVYLKGKADPATIELRPFRRGWFIDQTYADVVGGPGTKLFDAIAWFDRNVIDAFLMGIGGGFAALSGSMRRFQSGYVRLYGLSITTGAVLVVAYFLGRLWL